MHQRHLLGLGLVTPALSVLVVFMLVPILVVVAISFTDWNGISKAITFVGLANFVELMTSETFARVVLNTFAYVALTLPLTLVAGLGAALLVERPRASSTALRIAFTLPFVVSIAVVAVVWTWILNPQFGILNHILESLGAEPQSWLSQSDRAMLAIAVPAVWRQFGYYMLIFLSGLKGIDVTLHEAAKLDGAGTLTRTLRITLPLLSPQLFFALVLGVLDSFQVFAQVDLMTRGGPLGSTNVAIYYMYQQGFEFFRMGVASAVAVLLLVFLALMTFLQVRFLGTRVFYR